MSRRHRVSRPAGLLAAATLLSALACTGGGTPEPVEAPATRGPEAAPATPPAPPEPVLSVDGKPTYPAFKKAYAEIFQDYEGPAQPFEKSREAFVARMGVAPRIEGDKRVWWAQDGEGGCLRVELSEAGLSGDQTFDKAVAQAECGIAPPAE